MKKLVKQIRKKVEKEYGKKCEDFSSGCFICLAYRLVEDLEDMANGFKKQVYQIEIKDK